MAILFCKKCDRHLDDKEFAVDLARSTGRRYRCRSCSAQEFQNWKARGGYARRSIKERENYKRLKLENPRLRWAQRAKYAINQRVKKSGIPSDITLEWLTASLPDKCPLLEIDLAYGNDASYADSPAIDRKDNDKGYTTDNCWIISMKANRVKSNASVAEIVLIADNLVKLGMW